MGVPAHAQFIREAHKHVRFEWEEGAPFVDIFADGYPEPIAIGRSDFLALAGDVAALVQRMDAHQGGQVVSLYPGVTLLRGTPL